MWYFYCFGLRYDVKYCEFSTKIQDIIVLKERKKINSNTFSFTEISPVMYDKNHSLAYLVNSLYYITYIYIYRFHKYNLIVLTYLL